MSNPLLAKTTLPLFSKVKPEHVLPAIETLLQENSEKINALLSKNASYTFENFVVPLELLSERLNEVWGTVSHLSAVLDSEALRKAHDEALPKLVEYHTELGQNEELYKAFLSIFNNSAFVALKTEEKTILNHALRDFKLAGVSLPLDKKNKLKALSIKLSQLQNKFEQNVLDATQHWVLNLVDEGRLFGVPDTVKQTMQALALERGLPGFLVTLDFPTYDAIMTHAEDRTLRKEVYDAYTTLASEVGPHPKKWDNTALIEEILQLRQEMALLLDFDNYAEYSLATKMLQKPEEVIDFLQRFVARVKEKGILEYQALRNFAESEYQILDVHAWDIRFLSDKMLKKYHDISEEELRAYFPEKTVIKGLFSIVEKLFGITVKEILQFDTWHESVRLFEVYDELGDLRGKFYIDLYARPGKRPGAWCGHCKSRLVDENNEVQAPVAYIVANFRTPTAHKEALLSHEEVITTFHEFGHCLHHILTKAKYPSISGNNGVEWDAIELPSQLLENWGWEGPSLALLSAHVTTKQPLPAELVKRLKASKNFQGALYLIRQLEFALFDMKLHTDTEEKITQNKARAVLEKVRQEVSVINPPPYNRFQNSFSHIFAGGYAAGYYSYLWSEVLSADVFQAFLETDLFHRETGQRFLETVLEAGGGEEMMALFVAFRNRPPQEDALLIQLGLSPD
jgi:oligopeptidase A